MYQIFLRGVATQIFFRCGHTVVVTSPFQSQVARSEQATAQQQRINSSGPQQQHHPMGQSKSRSRPNTLKLTAPAMNHSTTHNPCLINSSSLACSLLTCVWLLVTCWCWSLCQCGLSTDSPSILSLVSLSTC